MGFPLDLCDQADDNHTAEYICVICTQLVESPVLTSCSHVFCRTCIESWIGRENFRCPTCSATLADTPAPLREASPLAWRVLGRVRVRCPLQGCKWTGEYSEVDSHLTNSESHVGRDGRRTIQTAHGLKEQADLKMDSRLYKEAIALYSKALALSGDTSSLLGRGRAWAAAGQPAQAVADARAALKIEPECGPAHLLLVQALLHLGQLDEAEQHLDSVTVKDERLEELERKVEKLRALDRVGREALEAKEFASARESFARLLDQTAGAAPVQLSLARAEVGTGMCDQAIRRTRELLRDDPNNGGVLTVRALALQLSGDHDQAWKHLQEALRLDPDDAETQHAAKRARKVQRAAEGAKNAAFNRRFDEAVQLATEAIDLARAPPRSPLHAQLFAERAAARLRLKEYDACLHDCAQALYGSDNECKPAALTRASALHALGRHEEALSDMEQLVRVYEHDPSIKHAYHRANFEVRKIRRTDLYALLQVPSVASVPEIKAAYKARALELHPDKVPISDTEGKHLAERRFKELGEALEILTDDFKRKLWDEGYDHEAIEQRVQAAQNAARHHTSDGCCGGGGCR